MQSEAAPISPLEARSLDEREEFLRIGLDFIAKRPLVGVGAGGSTIDSVGTIVYPDPEHADTQSVLDWAEDQLREV